MLNKTRKIFRKRPWLYIILFFIILFVADGIMVTLASKTWNGVSNKNAYEDGINYNQTLAQKQAEKALGWQTTIAFIPTASKQGTLELTLKNKNHQPINSAKITAKIVRPINEGHDFSITIPPQKNGLYSAPLAFPLIGQWQVNLTINNGKNTIHASKRIMVKLL